MKYQDVENGAYFVDQTQEKTTYNTRQLYMDHIQSLYEAEMTQRPSVASINEGLQQQLGDVQRVPKLRELPEQERARREALSRQCRENIVKLGLGYKFTTTLYVNSEVHPMVRLEEVKTAAGKKKTQQIFRIEKNGFDRTDKFFCCDVSGGPEAKAYNSAMMQLLYNPSGREFTKRDDKIAVYLEQFRDLDRWNMMDLVTRDLSDEELVARQEQIQLAMGRILQIENVRDAFSGSVTEGLDEDVQEMYDEMKQIMDRYYKFTERFDAVCSRYSVIENPMYAVVDPDDPALRELKELRNNGRVDLQEFKRVPGERRAGILTDYVDEQAYSRSRTIQSEIVSARYMLEARGVDLKNMVYRESGSKEDPKPLGDITRISQDMSDGVRHQSIEIFDKTDPTKRIIVANDRLSDITRTYVDEVKSEPPVPPRRPNVFKRFMHWVNSNNYKKDFDKYERDRSLYENEVAKQKLIAKGGLAEKYTTRPEKIPEKVKIPKDFIRSVQEREKIVDFLSNVKLSNPSETERSFYEQMYDIANKNCAAKNPTRTLLFNMVQNHPEMIAETAKNFKVGDSLEAIVENSMKQIEQPEVQQNQPERQNSLENQKENQVEANTMAFA